MEQAWSRKQFVFLLLVVAVAGLNQGLLLPLLATLLEERGVPSGWNGVNAAALYLGILVAAPFCGPVVRRFGYRWVIGLGLGATALCTLLFPVFTGFSAWLLLRFCIGVGDSLLHYASQLWITSVSPRHVRGRRISQYGLAYGIGFGLGPLGINLLPWGEWVPFVGAGALLAAVSVGLGQLDASKPALPETEKRPGRKWLPVYRTAFVALCAPFLYGFLEASLSGSFPIYGLRQGLSPSQVSFLISAFVYGSLLFQVPLGIWSDRLGRRRVLGWICLLGATGMVLVPVAMPHFHLLLGLFILIGGLLGSLFSLGLAYMADILPPDRLPEANALAAVHFSLGCMVGPYAGGWLIQTDGGASLFYFIATTLMIFVGLTVFYRPEPGSKGSASKNAA